MRRKDLLEQIGVEGSLNRRVLDLYESLGFVLRGTRDLGHSSRLVLVFRDGEKKYLSEVTIEDLPLPPKARSSRKHARSTPKRSG